jgi:hypothetical protein
MTTRRYAVLHHTGIDRPHFDLLFEMEPDVAALTTLRCPRWPVELGDLLDELPEHRRAYLDFEGEISGGRGSVRRIEAGEIDVADLTVEPPTLGLSLRSNDGAIELTIAHEFEAETSVSRWRVLSLRRADDPGVRHPEGA